jgi:hypothetical protein
MPEGPPPEPRLRTRFQFSNANGKLLQIVSDVGYDTLVLGSESHDMRLQLCELAVICAQFATTLGLGRNTSALLQINQDSRQVVVAQGMRIVMSDR